MSTTAVAQTSVILRVDIANGSVTGDGSDWGTDAFKFLQDALAAADLESDPVDIWVAAGTYLPTQGGPDASCFVGQTYCERCCSFRLRNNVRILGGFDGTEDQENKRDSEANITILSGDLNDDDDFSYTDNPLTLTFDNYTDNSYNVVRATSVNSTAILDGFTIRGGNAVSPHAFGGGLHIAAATPRIRNCNIRENKGMLGGGVAIIDSTLPTRFNNCIVEFNSQNGARRDVRRQRPRAPRLL